MKVLDQLLIAAVAEHSKYLEYEQLAEELEKRGLHGSAARLESMSRGARQHETTLQEVINEVKGIEGQGNEKLG
jgi:hypothetical protein